MEEQMFTILAEIEELKTQVIYLTQSNKAQTSLTDKLKTQIQHESEIFEYVRSENLILQSHIVEMERNINSMMLAHKTIIKANIELETELLHKKQKKTDYIKKFETSEKKYNALWLEAKQRFETIPHVQKLLAANEKLENAKKEIPKPDELSLKLVEEINFKTENCADMDKKRVIKLAEFIVRDIPKYHEIIDEKTKAIAELSEKIQEFETKGTRNAVTDKKVLANCETAADSEEPLFKADDIMIMPTLELPVREFDTLSVQSDKVNIENINTDNLNNEDEAKQAFPKTSFDINMDQSNKDDLISSYFPKRKRNEENETEKYSKRKLINIQHHINIDDNDARKMISKANIYFTETRQNSPTPSMDNKSKEPIQSDEIEEINLTSWSENILSPPSQFHDAPATTIMTENNLQEVDDEEELANSINETSERQDQVLSQQKDAASATERDSFNLTSNIKSNEVIGDIEENATFELIATDVPQPTKPVNDFVFNHGAHGIPDSLDWSFLTAGYGDDYSDLCLPKANTPTPSGSNTEVSQKEHDFLSSLRKIGLSFFGMLPTSESKFDTKTNQNAGPSSGFSFNFGGEDKKKAPGDLFK